MVVGISHIWFGTSATKIYRSTDAGATWTSSPTPISQSWGVWFNDTQYGIAIDSIGTAARSTDGGATWSGITLPGSGSSFGVSGAGADFWISRGTSVYHSWDRGLSWSPSFTGNVGALSHLNFIQTGSLHSGWAISSSGGIAGYTGTTTVVREARTNEPMTFALQQNYPNPFNPSTTIRFSLPEAGRISLRVFNTLGEEVAIVASGEFNAGTYDAPFDATALSSGGYFYRLETNSFSRTMKMVLTK